LTPTTNNHRLEKERIVKKFLHKFKDGTIIELKFDLSKPMPYCESNLQLDKQPIAILEEYRVWQNEIVLPEILRCMSREQMENFAAFGLSKMNQI
jgi:hypothetical protein